MINSYKGNEPFIFISYSHKDTNRVIPCVNALAEKGYRVWYDNGIEAGTEWTEYIAERLMASGTVVAFMSKDAQASHNCRREINFAIELKKELLIVYLEDFPLTPGMRLQLGSIQAMFSYKAPDEQTFYNNLCSAAILEPCLIKSEPKPELVTEPVTESEPESEPKPEPAPEPKSEPKSEPKPEPVTEPEPESEPEPKGLEDALQSLFREKKAAATTPEAPAVESDDAPAPCAEESKPDSEEKKPEPKPEPETEPEPNGLEDALQSLFREKKAAATTPTSEAPAADDGKKAPDEDAPACEITGEARRKALAYAIDVCNKSLKKHNHAYEFKTTSMLKPKQIANAINKHRGIISENDVLAIMDETLFGTGKTGFIVTENFFISNIWLFNYTLDLREIVAFKPSGKDDIDFVFKNNVSKTFYFSIYRDSFVDFFEAYFSSLKAL